VSTCRSWLNMWSLTDSDCRAGPHLARMDLPSLVVQATEDAGVFPSQAQEIYDAIAATDKRLEYMSGDHYFQEPANARDDVADLIAAWVHEH
jgi:esterase/lipase